MPDIVVTSVDLAEGLKPKNLVVPPMRVDVVLKNPAVELRKAIKDESLILQKIEAAAFAVVKKARDDVRDAILQLDQSYTKDPPADKREAEQRAETLNATCKKIAEAQSDAACAAAKSEWERQVKKNKDLTKFKVVFGLKMTLGTIAVAASVVSAVMSLGVLAITIVGAAKTVAGMASDIYSFCRDIPKTEGNIIGTDAVLAKIWTDDKLTAGKVGKELAAALGAPFVKSIAGLDKLLSEYNAKNAKKDQVADALWGQTKKLMASIDQAPAKANEKLSKTLKQLGPAVTKLLDQISSLSSASKSNDLFYDVYRGRCDTYKAMEGSKLGKTATATEVLVVLAGIASTADTIADVAMTLV
ncbi:MAG TPA: hypothetical protein VKI00_22190 [Mycobacterium sp.]|uniref:hypothetical protein n=1 Tax=Mycobacterium sp. TaxID=1785 RepID=UPI002CB88DC5|nr:hypothetical protein [Mycobacterium sp.]HME78256.1 hypothetical protein [Mycobacterium sp.]